jgi:hypothetical protein
MNRLIREALANADAVLAAQKAEREARKRELNERFARTGTERAAFLQSCRIAEPVDYANWLAGFLTKGGVITHPYDYPFDSGAYLDGSPARASWYVLTGNPTSVPELHGSDSLHVVVPANSPFPRNRPGRIGHSTFYFMNGYEKLGDWVPLYRDVAEILGAP